MTSATNRAQEFSARLGCRVDVTPPSVVQFTSHVSAYSAQFGTNLTPSAPGSGKGYLIVSDVQAARDALVAGGINVSEVCHLGPDGPVGHRRAGVPEVRSGGHPPISLPRVVELTDPFWWVN